MLVHVWRGLDGMFAGTGAGDLPSKSVEICSLYVLFQHSLSEHVQLCFAVDRTK